MFYDSPAPGPLVWAVASDLQWQAVCVVWIDNHYSTSELPAARVHKHNTAWRCSFVLFG